METTSYVTEITERLSPANRPEGFPELLVALLRELAKGSPVSQGALSAALGWPARRVAAVLAQVPGTEYDGGGNVVGYGVTLRETRHIFEIDGRRLYTWCALDALMFPAVIGKAARVLSRCPATGRPVSLTVAPDEVRNLEPAGAVVSLPLPEASADIRGSFCCHVHFFASASAADSWVSQHDGAAVVSVEDAFRLGHEIARKLLQGTEPRPS
ncbi:MAG TPA: organomercurial lyase MerB [Acidiferrobacterales bacterium]|nr:organomercurial lyase MerB [Acidiferrobacterales bacterium]